MKDNLLLPVLIGAAAAGAVAWLLISEDTQDLREDLLKKVADALDSVKEKLNDSVAG